MPTQFGEGVGTHAQRVHRGGRSRRTHGPGHGGRQRPGVTDNEIVIGTYTDLSGVTAMWGVNNTNAWRMVFDEANAEGGINGRKIKYIVEDMQYQVPRAVQAANKLINRDNVFIMVSNGGTPMNNATMPEQLAKGVPNIFPLTAARSMYSPLHHMKFGFAASYYDMERAGVKLFAEKYGKKAICAMSQDTDFGRDVMDGARDQLKAMNIQLVAETMHKPTDTDFSASVAKLHDANCDLILLGTIVRDTVQIVSAMRKIGLERRHARAYRDLRRVGGGGAGRRDRGHLHHDRRSFSRQPETRARRCTSSPTKYEKIFGHARTSPRRSAIRRRNWWCWRCRRRAAI